MHKSFDQLKQSLCQLLALTNANYVKSTFKVHNPIAVAYVIVHDVILCMMSYDVIALIVCLEVWPLAIGPAARLGFKTVVQL